MNEPTKSITTGLNQAQPGSVIQLARGKVPPQAVDLEEVVLGAMLVETKGAELAIPILKSGDVFYKDAHRLIFEAIESLFNDGSPIDLLTVSRMLRKEGNLESVGGDFYLVGLVQKGA